MSYLSWCAKWLVCTICMERKSSRYRMKAYVKRCCGITVKLRETPDINVYTFTWSKQKHNKLKSTSSPDAQSLFSMTNNDSDRNAGKKQMRQCDISYHMLAVHHSLRIIHRMEVEGMLINWSKIQWLTKMLIKLFLEEIWWIWHKRSIRRRALSKEDIVFYLLMALTFLIFQERKKISWLIC